MKIRIGIDIGKDGALARFIDGVCERVAATPKTKENEINMFALKELLKWWTMGEKDVHACIEDVHSVHGSSANSNFQFGRSFGIIEMGLWSLEIPFSYVAPKLWQKTAWEGVELIKKPSKSGKAVNDTKAISLEAVRRFHPEVSLLASSRCTTPHDGIVDAVLIGAYCNRWF